MKTKTVKIALEGFGSYLGMEKGCFIVKHEDDNMEKYALFGNLARMLVPNWPKMVFIRLHDLRKRIIKKRKK
jgi:hypothetical protein